MKLKDIQEYVTTLKLDPNSRNMLVISRDSGITKADLAKLKKVEGLVDTMLLVEGDVRGVTTVLPLEKNDAK